MQLFQFMTDLPGTVVEFSHVACLAQSHRGPSCDSLTLGYGVKRHRVCLACALVREVTHSIHIQFIRRHPSFFDEQYVLQSHLHLDFWELVLWNQLPALVAEHELLLGLSPICSWVRSAVADVCEGQAGCNNSLLGWIFADLAKVCQGDWLVCWID